MASRCLAGHSRALQWLSGPSRPWPGLPAFNTIHYSLPGISRIPKLCKALQGFAGPCRAHHNLARLRHLGLRKASHGLAWLRMSKQGLPGPGKAQQ
eukprot:6732921-Pyramimonas_sp.AAC.1